MNKLLLVGLLLLAPVSLASADLKIAVVDLSKAFNDYYKTKDAQNRLQQSVTNDQKEVQDLINEYQRKAAEADTLNKAVNDMTLSAATRQDKATALQAKKQDLLSLQNKIQEARTERGRELEEEKFRMHQDIVGEISKVITDYSGPQGYDLVIDKSNASAASGISVILYNSSKLVDITSEIITLLNKSAPAGSSTTSGATPSASTTPAPATP